MMVIGRRYQGEVQIKAVGDGAPKETQGSGTEAAFAPVPRQQYQTPTLTDYGTTAPEGAPAFRSRFGDEPRSDGRDLVDMNDHPELAKTPEPEGLWYDDSGPGHCFTCDTPLTDTDESGGWFCSDVCRRFATGD